MEDLPSTWKVMFELIFVNVSFLYLIFVCILLPLTEPTADVPIWPLGFTLARGCYG